MEGWRKGEERGEWSKSEEASERGKAGAQGEAVSKPHGVPSSSVPRKSSPENTLNMDRSVDILSRRTRPGWAVDLELTSSEDFCYLWAIFSNILIVDMKCHFVSEKHV